MAIKLATVPEVERSVAVSVPTATGGHRKERLRVTYKLLTVEEYRETAERQKAEPDIFGDDVIMRRDVTNIRGVQDEDGKEMDFSSDVLFALLNRADTRDAIIKGWQDVQINREAESAKN